jgi:predicted negative regulator of RcsB-dependent stress response
LAQLAHPVPVAFAALVADRRGDVLMGKGQALEARQAYESAYQTLSDQDAYKALVGAKLSALGVSPQGLKQP